LGPSKEFEDGLQRIRRIREDVSTMSEDPVGVGALSKRGINKRVLNDLFRTKLS
jgi:hypothetical protein